jgi:hypothetical protein
MEKPYVYMRLNVGRLGGEYVHTSVLKGKGMCRRRRRRLQMRVTVPARGQGQILEPASLRKQRAAERRRDGTFARASLGNDLALPEAHAPA